MKRSKKLFINISIIIILLLCIYYYGPYYLSKEQCMIEMLRSNYCYEREVAMEFEYNHILTTVVIDEEQKYFSVIKMKKLAFLYHPSGNSMYEQEIKKEGKISVQWSWTKGEGLETFIYRNDTAVEKIEITIGDGKVLIFDEWENNFIWFLEDVDAFYSGTYKAYNAAGEVIEEGRY